ncbi:hypothetical protein CR513_16369, partial [Mucuna pruriens]
MESNLHDCPAFFNCYPYFSMNLRNNKNKIYYKVTKVDYNYKAIRASPKDETILLEANYIKSLVQVPKKLRHEEVLSKIHEEWLLEEIIEEPKIYNSHIREIIQEGHNISTIGVIDNNWKTIDNKIIRLEYPPQQGITIEFANINVEASPFKDIIKDLDKVAEKSDIKKLHSQMNYSNTVLEIMSKQLARIEGLKHIENKDVLSSSTSKPLIKSIYKLINVPQKELEY